MPDFLKNPLFTSFLIPGCLVVLTILKCLFPASPAYASGILPFRDLSRSDAGRPAQVEVGGPYAGVEFHGSQPLPGRISFFHPVANSLDNGNDASSREENPVIRLQLRRGSNPPEIIGREPWKYSLSPWSVRFHRQEKEHRIEISYRFCLDMPGFVMTVDITNLSKETGDYELSTSFDTTLRTSSTYALKKPVRIFTPIGAPDDTFCIRYQDPETGPAVLMVTAPGTTLFTDFIHDRTRLSLGRRLPEDPPESLTFSSRKSLAPGERMTVNLVIGTCRPDELGVVLEKFRTSWEQSVQAYENSVREKAAGCGTTKSGDLSLDFTADWAKAILAVNHHYLDGALVPMPCPAEYNLFFTHDVQKANMAAVLFDPDRVRRDLEFIASRADEKNIIPHAYYWKDDRFFTEFAGPDNWNHLWFVIVTSRYLRHTGDLKLGNRLYPLISASIEEILKNHREGLIWANRPDWWDIGDSFGPRSYMTILTARALREYGYITYKLGNPPEKALNYQKIAAELEKNLTEKLWDDKAKYLTNYNIGGVKDEHYYMGSILAVPFGLLEPDKSRALIKTAKEKLLDEELGIRTVYPMDFHTLKDFFKFQGDEAGGEFSYLNGGIWAHANAWYALALIHTGQQDEAYEFMKRIMTIRGVMESPGGAPAMYEYRSCAPPGSKNRGAIEKPQFMWAASWYLYTWYELFGLRQNEWNLSFEPYIPPGLREAVFTLSLGGHETTVTIRGVGERIREIRYDGEISPSAVIPEEKRTWKTIEIQRGTPGYPYITKTNSVLQSARWNERNDTLEARLRAYPGHESCLTVVSPLDIVAVEQNGESLPFTKTPDNPKSPGCQRINVEFTHKRAEDRITLKFR